MNDWAYYINTSSGQSYQIENGIVVAIGNYKPIQHSPVGWADISLIWERSATKYGLTRSFSLPLGFVIDGQSILSYLNWSNNFEQQLNLLINRKTLYIDTTNYYFYMKFFYKGEIDLSTYNYDDDSAKASVNVMEGGLSKQLNASQDTVYTFPLTDNFIWVKMDGIIIDSIRNWKNPTQTISSIDSPPFSVPLVSIPGENDGVGVVGQSQTEADSHTGMLLWGDPIPVHVQGPIKFTVNAAVTTLKVSLIRLSTTFSPTEIRFQDYTPNTTDIFEFDINDDFTFAPGEQLLLTITALAPTLAGLPDRAFSFIETNIVATLQARGAQSYIRAKKPSVLGGQLINNITGDANNFQSGKILANDGIVVASGDSIRGIDGATIKTSFNQYFNSYNVVLNLGCGIENKKIIIEDKAHFFQTDNPIQLGVVKQYKDNWAQDYLFNTLNIGYPDVNIDDVNGKYAFNTSVIWSSPVTKVKKEFLLKSDYKADPYEIELMRIKYVGQTTTDALQDNDIYFLDIDLAHPETLTDGRIVYPLLRPPMVITGVPNGDTVFNIRLSIRRIIETHKNWIGGLFSEFQSGKLHFESTQRNRDLNAGGIDEDADILISSLGAPLFKPVNFDFLSPFYGVGDLSLSLVTVYDENTDWVVTGSGDANDTTDPFHGTKNIKIAAITRPEIIFTHSTPLPFGVLDDINFRIKLGTAFGPTNLLRVSFYKGTVIAKAANVIINRGDTANYQQAIVNVAALVTNNAAITEFDSIHITVSGFTAVSFVMDLVQLRINPQNDLTNIMDQNPNRCFQFTHPNGKQLKGHSIKVGAAPNTEQEQGFLLLATGDIDLKDLIP